MESNEQQPPLLEEEGDKNHGGSTRVDRLLKERIKRNRSHQLFDYDEAQIDGPLDFVHGDGSTSERLVVVANRLPVTCSKDQHGHWQLQVSAGGLVSALKGVSTYTTMWIGWPGIWVKPGRERDALTAMLVQEGCIPVWIDPTLLDMYYNGFCNSVLWQLFHYVPLNIDSWQKMSEHRAMQMQWQAYQVANQRFADVVLENYQPRDIMWIQDYHLMVLPSLLKAAVPKMKVGFFLHTPFPSSEMYRTLPVREEVLRAVLGADLIGFHTYDYARHFISSCTRILGLEGTPEGVENNGTISRVGTFPIGIDPERFTLALETDEVQSHVAKLLNRYAGRKIMLGVDRLDMVKGIPQKLLAFEKFLEEHPEWRDKVLLVQIAVPSRTDVSEYQKLRSMVHEIVGRINGQFGTLTYVPIYHLDTSLSFTELCALYAVTDVALVTSLRDGMNLVSYEYVACQSDNAGVLVLSEFAGAAQSLGAGAILVNPWNITDMAQAIEDSLCMSEEERRERHRQNYMHVQTHTAQHWADTFISELNDTHIEAALRMKHAPPPLDMQEVVQAYKNSGRRLFVLGYNATLTINTDVPVGRAGGLGTKRAYQEQLGKSQAKVNPKILASLHELSQDPRNVLVIFSGSETHKLEDIFGDMPVWLAAENGVFVRPPPQHLTPAQRGKRPWRALFHGISKEWMESVQLVFDYFCERTPRSSVEVRETSLVWNYKYADVEFGRIQARDLLQHLWTGPISNAPVEIIQGGKSVEVRPVSVTKGMSTQRMVGLMADIYGLDGATFDMVVCIGHLLGRDENMYSFFEGVKVESTAATTTTGETGRKNAVGNPSLPAPTQAQQLLQALHKQHQHYTHHLPPSLQFPGASSSGSHTRAPSSPRVHSSYTAIPSPFQSHNLANANVANANVANANVANANVANANVVNANVANAGRPGQLQAELGQQALQQHAVQQQQAAVQQQQAAVTAQQLQQQHAAVQQQAAMQAQAHALQQQQQQQQQQHADLQIQQQQQNQQGLARPTPMHASRPLAIPSQPPPAAMPAQSDSVASMPSEAVLTSLQTQTSPHLLAGDTRSNSDELRNASLAGALRACSASAPPHRDGMMLPARNPGVSEPGIGPMGNGAPSECWSDAHGCRSPGSTESGVAQRAERQLSFPQEMELPPFPPRYLFTCTVGRNRSKARYALSSAQDVSDLLESIVQQAIYNQQPPHLSAPNGQDGAGANGPQGTSPGGGVHDVPSFSSAEPLSPDSMFTLINNWKNFRTAGTGTTTPLAAGADPQQPQVAAGPGTYLQIATPTANDNKPGGDGASSMSTQGQHPLPPIPTTSLHSHMTGSVVNSWAADAALAYSQDMQRQQLQQHQQHQHYPGGSAQDGAQLQYQHQYQQQSQPPQLPHLSQWQPTPTNCAPHMPADWHLPSTTSPTTNTPTHHSLSASQLPLSHAQPNAATLAHTPPLAHTGTRARTSVGSTLSGHSVSASGAMGGGSASDGQLFEQHTQLPHTATSSMSSPAPVPTATQPPLSQPPPPPHHLPTPNQPHQPTNQQHQPTTQQHQQAPQAPHPPPPTVSPSPQAPHSIPPPDSSSTSQLPDMPSHHHLPSFSRASAPAPTSHPPFHSPYLTPLPTPTTNTSLAHGQHCHTSAPSSLHQHQPTTAAAGPPLHPLVAHPGLYQSGLHSPHYPQPYYVPLPTQHEQVPTNYPVAPSRPNTLPSQLSTHPQPPHHQTHPTQQHHQPQIQQPHAHSLPQAPRSSASSLNSAPPPAQAPTSHPPPTTTPSTAATTAPQPSQQAHAPPNTRQPPPTQPPPPQNTSAPPHSPTPTHPTITPIIPPQDGAPLTPTGPPTPPKPPKSPPPSLPHSTTHSFSAPNLQASINGPSLNTTPGTSLPAAGPSANPANPTLAPTTTNYVHPPPLPHAPHSAHSSSTPNLQAAGFTGFAPPPKVQLQHKSSCPVPSPSLVAEPLVVKPVNTSSPPPTHTQHGPICPPPPPPAVVQQAAQTTLYCPMPANRLANWAALSLQQQQQSEQPQQDGVAAPKEEERRDPGSEGTRTPPQTQADEALAHLRSLAHQHLRSSSRSEQKIRRSPRGNKSFSYESAGGSAGGGDAAPGSPQLASPPGGRPPLLTKGGSFPSSTGRLSHVTSYGMNLDGLGLPDQLEGLPAGRAASADVASTATATTTQAATQLVAPPPPQEPSVRPQLAHQTHPTHQTQQQQQQQQLPFPSQAPVTAQPAVQAANPDQQQSLPPLSLPQQQQWLVQQPPPAPQQQQQQQQQQQWLVQQQPIPFLPTTTAGVSSSTLPTATSGQLGPLPQPPAYLADELREPQPTVTDNVGFSSKGSIVTGFNSVDKLEALRADGGGQLQ